MTKTKTRILDRVPPVLVVYALTIIFLGFTLKGAYDMYVERYEWAVDHGYDRMPPLQAALMLGGIVAVLVGILILVGRRLDRAWAEANAELAAESEEARLEHARTHIGAVTPCETLVELRDALHDLNYERGIDTAAVVINDVVHLAYCTDPDGEWFLENGDPEERISEDETGWRRYERLSLNDFDRGPYTIIWPAAPAAV